MNILLNTRTMQTLFLAYLALISLITFGVFADDKARAMAGRRRTAEATLLKLAMLGGSPGALCAQHLLRHKTRKQPFAARLNMIAAIQILLLGVLVFRHGLVIL